MSQPAYFLANTKSNFQTEDSILEDSSLATKKRIPGLSQEYPVRKNKHEPESYTFKPQIKKFIPET